MEILTLLAAWTFIGWGSDDSDKSFMDFMESSWYSFWEEEE